MVLHPSLGTDDPTEIVLHNYSILYPLLPCRYETTGNDSSVKMHRSISSGDVKKYSTGAHKKEMQLQKEEDIEYRSGHLYHSSGLATVKIVKRFPSRDTTLQEGPLNEDLLTANGSYVLDLLRCYTVPSMAKRGRRSARKPMIKGSLGVVPDRGNFSFFPIIIKAK